MTAESHGMRYRTAHRFVPTGEGTRVEIEFSGRAVSLGAKLLLPLGALMMSACRKALNKDLADLKRAIEAGT
jgi:Polyketide cyclase / dehydrase and lipid transport.